MSSDKDSSEDKEELKGLFKRLGEIINETLADSEDVQEVLGQIRNFGLGVDLSMVMGLGFHYRPDVCQDLDGPFDGKIRFELTSGDRKFLGHNKISLDIDSENNISEK